MEASPLVSIILPLYNAESFLQPTLDSVLAQTHRRWELIVVDDGSKDDGLGLCKRVGDERFRLFPRENSGPCRSRNFGIGEARGELVAFMDHDDLWHPTKLEKHIEHLARRPSVGVSYGPSEMINLDGSSLGLLQAPKLEGITPRDILLRNPVGNGSAPIIRKEVLDAVAFEAEVDGRTETMYFDDQARSWEDVELWLRIAFTTDWAFEGIPDCLTKYRIVPGGIAGNPEKKQTAFEAGLERVRRYAPEFVDEHGPAGRAFHLRYLARRLIHAGEAAKARGYLHRALAAYPGIVLEDPGRTISTVGATYLMSVLPKPVFDRIKRIAIDRTRAAQQTRVKSS